MSKKFKKEGKIYYLKLFNFFNKDPDLSQIRIRTKVVRIRSTVLATQEYKTRTLETEQK